MRKVSIHGPGSYERLLIEEAPDPKPSAGQIVVDVHAAGVNYADCIVRMGLYESAKKYVGWPITPGFEVAGKVLSIGEGVTGFEPGQTVLAVTRFGGYASRVCVPADQVFPLPRGFSVPDAAGFPAVFMTAYYALYELVRLRSKMTVLVHSAAGGVGGALVQLAKIAGCRVVGVVGSSSKVSVAKDLGADAVIDKSREPLWQRAEALDPDGYDIVLDANGVETLGESYKHMKPSGRLIIYGFHTMMPKRGGKPDWIKLAWDFVRTPRFNPLDLTNDNKSVLAFNLSYLFHEKELLREGMEVLTRWADEGRIKPPPVTTFPFERVADAHRAIESGTTVGKLVLTF